MRGVAALLVVVLHSSDYFGAFHFHESFLAVDLFFALSGFVVAEAYQDRLSSGMRWREFMRLRLIRFYPLYLLGSALGLMKAMAMMRMGDNRMHFTPANTGGTVAFAVLMLPSPFMQDLYPLLPSAWSLGWELLVNAAYAVVRPWMGPGRMLIVMAVAGLSLLAALDRLGSVSCGLYLGWESAWMAASRVGFSFTAGLLIQRIPRCRWRLPPSVILAMVFLALTHDSGAFRAGYELAFVFLVSPALIYFGAGTEPRGGREARAYAFLGASSYAIYVLHEGLGQLLEGALKRFAHTPVQAAAPWGGLALVVGLVAVCAWLDRHYDGPLRHWLGRARKA